MLINPSYVLVVGGAGFIGSHMVLALQEAGFSPIVLDNLSKGHRDAVINATFVEGDMGDETLLNQLFSDYSFVAVMHFASFIEVGESVQFPEKYYANNVAKSIVLLNAVLTHKVKHVIFSSTAAVYGEPQYTPIDEAHPIAPINPYGKSKAMVEEIIKDYASAHNFNYAILRYFNAAGADPLARLGERHEPESHLIPIILQVARGIRQSLVVNGDDYPTHDGTCVRDYVHVTDLCDAHLLALNYLIDRKKNILCNLGTSHGYSINEVVLAARAVTKHALPVLSGKRRAGDPAVLVSDAALASKVLNWQPKYRDLDAIIQHAWNAVRKFNVTSCT